MSFEGSCHCGSVTFKVDAPLPDKVIDCNCSHCRRKGFLLSFLPASTFTLKSGEDKLATYRFNTCQLAHRFCQTCGTQPFAEGENKDGGEMRAVNLRCVPGADLESFEIEKFDGASQ